jgi:uncharacterized cupin superfamily protein
MTDDTYILTANDIDEMEGVAKTHFLNPDAKRLNKSLGDRTGLTGFGFHLIEVEPGHQTTEHHCHHHEDECVFVLSGSATAVIGNEERVIRAGDFIGYRKGGLAHSIRNTGSEVLRCIVVGERREHDVCDYPLLRKRMYRQSGLAPSLVDVDQIQDLGDHVGKK